MLGLDVTTQIDLTLERTRRLPDADRAGERFEPRVFSAVRYQVRRLAE